MPDKDKIDAFDKKVMTDILEVGWSDIAVFPTADDPGLWFNYSVGLTEREHPELLVIGLDNEQMHALLWSAIDRIKNHGETLQPNTLSTEVLIDFEVGFVEVEELRHPDHMMSMAYRIYGDKATGLQIVWPDTNGRFPWHDDFNPEWKDRQPLAGTWKGPL